MPVTERLMSLGDWSVRLHPDTPRSVRDLVNPFNTGYGHIVITAAPLDHVAGLSDAGLLAAARYVGVRTVQAGPAHELAGYGLAWWLGDADHQGNIILTAVSYSAVAFETVITGLLAAGPTTPIAAGTIETSVGNYTGQFLKTSPRAAIDTVCGSFGREWKVNPNFTLDAGSVSSLYGGTQAQALAVRKGGARDINTTGIESDLAVAIDLEQTFTEVVVEGRGDSGSAGGANGFGWRDGRGNTVRRTALFEASDKVAPGQESNVATQLLARYNLQAGRRDLILKSSQYNVEGSIACGAYIGVYDPDLDVLDLTNPDFYGGEEVFPALVRVVALKWALTEGHGVYYRHTTGASTYTLYDLTPYVAWEEPGADIEIVTGGDADFWSMAPSTGRVDPVSQARDRAKAQAWDSYTPTWTASTTNPTIGNGTLTGWFRREGTTLELRISIIPGSTTNTGSGTYTISLPSGLSTATGGEQWITCKIYDGANWPGIAVASGTGIQAYFPSAQGDVRLTVWQHNTPAVTFANGHNFHLQGTIEIAP